MEEIHISSEEIFWCGVYCTRRAGGNKRKLALKRMCGSDGQNIIIFEECLQKRGDESDR